MKKYLMIGAAALLMGASFTSCSKDKDLYDPTANAAKFLQDYQAAFISVFGTPSANQTWGFGDPAASRMTRAITPDYDFNAAIPTKPTTDQMAADNFKTDAYLTTAGIMSYQQVCASKGNADWTPTEFQQGDCYIDANYTGTVKITGGNSKLYVKGSCDMTDGREFYLGANMEIYLLEGATLTVPQGFQQGTKVYIAKDAELIVKGDVSTGTVSYYSDGGSITVNGKLVINQGHELFMKGGSLTVNGELFQLQPATACLEGTDVSISGWMDINHGWLNGGDVAGLYYQTGGSFAASQEKLICDSGIFYSDVNTSFSYIEANQKGVIYNAANSTMTSTGKIRVTNSNSVLINDGDLIGTYLGTEGSAKVQNNGIARISGNTIVNSNNNTWVNNGTYYTDNFIYHAGSSQVINNCRMIVSNNFDINTQDNNGGCSFQMDTESSVSTRYLNAGCIKYTYYDAQQNKDVNYEFNGGPFYIYMNSGSVFDVTETATLNASNPNYGIYCTGNDWAVFHANKIQGAAGQENQAWKVTYGGKLAVISETTHFPQGNDGQADHHYIEFANGCTIANICATNEPFSTNDVTVNIPASLPCNPGFSRGGVEPETESIRIMAEDVAASAGSDIDFNDLVFDVEATFPVVNGAVATSVTTVSVTIQAAGGTMPIYINGREAHAELGLTGPNAAKTMVNTNAAAYADGVNYFAEDGRAPASFDLTIDGGISKDNFLQDVNKKIKITLQREGSEIVVIAHPGEPTAKIAVPVGTPWAKEKVNMNTAFGKFSEWVQTCSPTEWYKIYDGDMVIE